MKFNVLGKNIQVRTVEMMVFYEELTPFPLPLNIDGQAIDNSQSLSWIYNLDKEPDYSLSPNSEDINGHPILSSE